jgi:hypothetical protein
MRTTPKIVGSLQTKRQLDFRIIFAGFASGLCVFLVLTFCAVVVGHAQMPPPNSSDHQISPRGRR